MNTVAVQIASWDEIISLKFGGEPNDPSPEPTITFRHKAGSIDVEDRPYIEAICEVVHMDDDGDYKIKIPNDTDTKWIPNEIVLRELTKEEYEEHLIDNLDFLA